MEDTFTFLENEIVSQEFTDKLNDNYSIKEIKFELDHEITENDYNDIFCEILNYKVDIIKNSLLYYSNILVFKCNPFKYLDNLSFDCYKIELYEIRCLNNIKSNAKGMFRKTYIKCHITFQYNDIFIDNSESLDNNNKYILSSNYFDKETDVKLYFMNWTGLNEDIYKEWLLIFLESYSEQSIINLYSKNFNNQQTKIIYEINLK